MTEPNWRTSDTCTHENDNVCPTCDFDRYYATAYPESCPWAGESDPSDPQTEPIRTIKAAQHSAAHYVNVGPRHASEPVPAGDVAVQQGFETGLPDKRAMRRGRMLDWLDRGLWITSIVLATFVGLAVVWALIAEPMGWWLP